MAVCNLCNREMTSTTSCTVSELHTDGKPFALSPFGSDPSWVGPSGRCGDCGVEVGGFHHLGCDIQPCPRCGGQLFCCGCRWDEFAHQYGEWDPDEEVDPVSGLRASDRKVVVLRPASAVTSTPPLPIRLVPFTAAVAPLRARHQAALRSLAEAALASGHPVDLGAAALVLDLLERHRDAGGYRLTRPDVLGVFDNESWNWASGQTTLPDDWAEQVWWTLTHLAGLDLLHPDSDPLDALREPMRCIGGLDAHGRLRPPGEPPGFACQCYHPYDPACPPGYVQQFVGRDEHDDMLAYATATASPGDVPVRMFEPLHRYARRMRDQGSMWEVRSDEFHFQGEVLREGQAPRLFLYRFAPGEGRYDLLALDEDGKVWVPRRDGRRKRGYRWVETSDRAGVARSGIMAAQSAPFTEPTDTGYDDV